jgi:hypothetical protein
MKSDEKSVEVTGGKFHGDSSLFIGVTLLAVP